MPIKELRGNSLILPAHAMAVRDALFFGVLLVAAFFWPSQAQADMAKKPFLPIMLAANAHGGPLGQNIIIQKDIGGNVSAQRIRETMGTVLNGSVSSEDVIALGTAGNSHWLSFKILNKNAGTNWILDLGRFTDGRRGHLEKIHVYEMPLAYPGASVRPAFYLNEISSGSRDGSYSISVSPQSQKLIIVHVQATSGIPASIAPSLYSQNELAAKVYSSAFYNSSYVMILFGMGLIALISTVRSKQKNQIVFALYFALLASCYLVFDRNGINPDFRFYKIIVAMAGILHITLAVQITKIICHLDHRKGPERYILNGLIIGSVVAMILLFIPLPEGIFQSSITHGVPLSVYGVLAIMTLAQTLSGQTRGYSFFLSWLLPLLGITISIMTNADMIPATFVTLNALWLSYPLQGVLLGIGMMRSDLISRSTQLGIQEPAEKLTLDRLKQTRDEADHSRLLRVIEKERELLAELKQREAIRLEEATRAKEEADEANRAKSAFLAVVSHEIRTPMTGIMGMVRLLLDSNITKQQKDYALTIQESGDSMLGLLNDILDFEKIQRGKMDLENISFDLHRMIQGVVALMSGHAAQKQITLSARVDDDLPRFVKGDPTRLRQVLLNLMGNALKFTEDGSVTLQVKNLKGPDSASHQGNNFMIYFAVTDTGIGISEAAQKNLFSPFAQADSTIARKFGGSGLGLAISKGLVEAMGSTVNINSQPGEGSTFFFTLKMERGISSTQDSGKKASDVTAASIPQIRPLHVLVVDDNTINRKVIGSFLMQDNHTITPSTTAEDALKKLEAQDFDLVLMDIELPGITGNEATKILRGHTNPHKANIPVIALTGNVGKEDMGRYLADGMNGLVPKPIDIDQLRGMIFEVMTRSNQREIKTPDMAKTAATEIPNKINSSFETSATIPPSPPEVIKEETKEADINVFNPMMLQSLRDAIGMDQLQKLLDELLEKTDEILAGMELASRAGNMELLSARAHELKGMAGNFGLVEISEIAALAERKARSDEKEDIPALVNTLPAANLRARRVLKEWSANGS